jgi:hypothetical protein
MNLPTNPLAGDPEIMTEFRARVERGDWKAARRLGLALALHRSDPQQIFERDDAYLQRLADRYAPPLRTAARSWVRGRSGRGTR